MTSNKITISPKLVDDIKNVCQQHKEIVLVSLATTDGFSIKSFAFKSLNVESDKLAAMSSTIASLSDSSVDQILDDQFDIAIVESKSGNMLFVKTSYMGIPSVLTTVSRIDLPLATARYLTKKLAKDISEV